MKVNIDKQKLNVVVSSRSINNFRPFLTEIIGDVRDVVITGKAQIVETASGGHLGINLTQIEMEWDKVQTATLSRRQMNTVKVLERFVCIGMNGLEPSEGDMQFIHEAFKDSIGYNIEGVNIDTDYTTPVKKSLSAYKSWESSMFIQRIFEFIMEMDMHSEAKRIIGGEIKNLFLHWNTILGKLGHRDHLSIEEYAEQHQFSEISGVKVPVEKMHIISKGANEEAYLYSWNIIMGSREEHSMQHTMGWERFVMKYPHLEPKYKRAQNMVGKLNGKDKAIETE